MLLFGLLLVFVLDYTRPDQFFPFIMDLKLYSIIPIALFVVTWAVQGRSSNGEILGSTMGRTLLWLLLFVSISALLAIHKDTAWQLWKAYFGYLLLFFMIAKICDTTARIQWVFRIIVGIHVWLVYQNPLLLTDPTQRTYVQNVTFLGDGNDFSLSAAMALPMCLYLYQTARGAGQKAFALVGALVIAGAIMGTQSRGAGLAVIALAMYLWIIAKSKGKATVFVAVGAMAVLAVASETYLTRMQTIRAYEQDGSATSRLFAWGAGVGMANRRPLTGVGPGCFPIAFGGWGYSRPGMPMMNAHSVYFQALGELGYPGFLLLLWVLWTMFRNNQRSIKALGREPDPARLEYRRLLVAVTGSLVVFAVAGAFLSVLYYPHLFVIAGLVYAVRRVYLLDCPAAGDAPPEPGRAGPAVRRRARLSPRGARR